MTEKKKQMLADVLKYTISQTDKWFKNEEYSKAHIVGYLQGVIKAVISELETTDAKH